MQFWQLPEYIADILPSTARRLESAKEELLTLFRAHGYELVSPPLMEYTQSLLTRIDPGLSLKTIRITDQLSGLQLGLRADITPQISRIDAHLLVQNNGVNRLCYAGAVLHAQPDTLYSTREPLQIGAELYGFEGLAADIELIDLMLKSVARLGVDKPLLSLGHIGVFRALSRAAALSDDNAQQLLGLMQSKDGAAVAQWCAQQGLPENLAQAFVELTVLYGAPDDVLARAERVLPACEGLQAALNDLREVCQTFSAYAIHVDLAELRVDYYHSGLLFAAYRKGDSDALARGGRYDGLGRYFGRPRPATGFSFDLKNFLDLLPQQSAAAGICVAATDAAAARDTMDTLRAQGEIVLIDYLNEGAAALNCDRVLTQHNRQWQVIAATEE
ncbi:MAG: ATP phosphoribosyltransferase regulatory subunit [Neisseria sp.]|nr:ATP phosphoribosyltransferase regulatory subunit [Neisseria sp.]